MSNQLPILWVEKEPGYLKGTILNKNILLSTLIDELISIPIDVPTLYSDLETKEVTLEFPDTFTTDRKQAVYSATCEVYPNWKIELEDSLKIYPNFKSEQEI